MEKGGDGEGSKEVQNCSLPDYTQYDPKTEDISLSLKIWAPLAIEPVEEWKQIETKDSPHGPPLGEEVVLSPPFDKHELPSISGLSVSGPLCFPIGRFGSWRHLVLGYLDSDLDSQNVPEYRTFHVMFYSTHS